MERRILKSILLQFQTIMMAASSMLQDLHIMTSTATYPHQVAGSTIDFELVCQHDTDNDSINFEKIIVSGWKKAGASVSVSYQE